MGDYGIKHKNFVRNTTDWKATKMYEIIDPYLIFYR